MPLSLLRMKNLLLALILSFVYLQTTEAQITIDAKEQTVTQILRQVEQLTSYRFFYEEGLPGLNKVTSIKMRNSNISTFMKQLLAGTDLAYKEGNDNLIIITAQGYRNPKRGVSGVVTDANGEPIIGASVSTKTGSIGTITDINGKFNLEVTGKDLLVVNYLGFERKEISTTNKDRFDIRLEENAQALDEVIVVGYGAIRKRDLTGAISSVKAKELPTTANASIGQMLSGKAAGLQVLQNSAQPGGGISFLIRGGASVGAGNEPLIIIDGFPISSFSEPGSGNAYDGGSKSDLNSINPNDIESVEVLKDASATAIYGARAANGVILITTKRGKEGKVRVEYNGGVSSQIISDKYNVMNASQLMQTINVYNKEEYLMKNNIFPYGDIKKTEQEINAVLRPRFSDEQIANPAAQTNWFDEITRPGFITQHNVGLYGGTQSTQYLVSLSYYKQDGVIKNSGLERYSGRVNLDQSLGSYFKVGLSATVSRVNNTNSQLGGAGNELSGIIRSALTFPTFLPIKDANGDYTLSSTQAYLPNPVSLLEISDQSIMERLLGTAYLEITPTKGLTIRASAGIDRNVAKRTTYLPKSTLYGAKEGGKASIGTNERLDLLTNIVATYNFTFLKDHHLTAMAGFEYQRFQADSYSASNSSFLLDSFLWYNLAAGEAKKPTVSSSGSVEQMASFFGRIHYNYKDRYLLTATLRADGSSRFAKNKKWGYFPSMAAAWRISEEPFMEFAKEYVSNLKLRVSYGATGNANIGYNALAAYRTGANYQFGDKIHVGVYNSQLENPNLSWETTTELNVGLDVGILNERISLSVEYFDKIISGLLSTRSLPTYNEVTVIADNIGKTQSRGFELTLNTTNIKKKSFTWTSAVTFSLYRDRWLERAPTWVPAIYQNKTNYIRNNFFYQSDGLIAPGESPSYMQASLPGQVKLLDMNGYLKDENGNRLVDEEGKFIYSNQADGVLDDADIVNYGSADPGYMFGFNNTFLYQGFDLNIYFYGYLDFKKIDPNIEIGTIHQLGQHQGGLTTLMNSWRHDNMNTSQPSLFTSSFGYGDYFLQDASFLRCKNITLGYTFPQKWVGKVCQKLRLYFDCQNPFILTAYTGIDPETDTYTAAYPNARSFSFGIDVTF